MEWSPACDRLMRLTRVLVIVLALLGGIKSAHAGDLEIVRLLDELECPKCDLRKSDLIQASLEGANLQGANLERANLSGANLDGANLSNTNLTLVSLNGASLRGANLIGANLYGADLRRADLDGAKIDSAGLQKAHWKHATGIQGSILKYADLHNAGVSSTAERRWQDAERWFSEAIQRKPDAAISWLGRGLTRAESGNLISAAQDIKHASRLYSELGDTEFAGRLHDLSDSLVHQPQKQRGGNGAGITAISGAVSVLKLIAPFAMKALVPLGI